MSEIVFKELPPTECLSADQAYKEWGWNKNELRSRRRCHWREGQHFAIIAGEARYYFEEIELWLMSKRTITGSCSDSESTGSQRSTQRSTSNQQSPISDRRSARRSEQKADSKQGRRGIPSERISEANVSRLPNH